jgi:hypothetical protein
MKEKRARTLRTSTKRMCRFSATDPAVTAVWEVRLPTVSSGNRWRQNSGYRESLYVSMGYKAGNRSNRCNRCGNEMSI